MEPMSVSISETRLKVGNIDAMARVEKDNVAPTNNTAMADSIIEGDDW
jgi:hypothetical protein